MNFTRPTAILAAPLTVLGLGLAVLLLDPYGAAQFLRQAAAHLMTHDTLARPLWAQPAEIGALLAAGTLVLVAMLRLRLYWTILLTAALVSCGFYAAWFAMTMRHWLIDAATPGITMLALLAAGAAAQIRAIRHARTELRLAFSDSLPRATIEKIARRPQLLTIAGQSREITYLVCGVRGLSELADSYTGNPKSFTNLVQQVLSPLLDQVLAHGGTIDRLTADGFAAFWNAPLDDADHATHACDAAGGMSIMASRVGDILAQERPNEPLPRIEIGVGIATGHVIAGGFGGQGRLGYSVTGPAVTLAAHIQARSTDYGPAVIVAEETRTQAARGFAFLEVDMIANTENAPVRLYAMMGNSVIRSSPKFRALTTFHEHIFHFLRSRQWNKARELIAQCRKLSGASPSLYDLHLARIRYYEANPPGPDWDGAFRQILK